MFMKSILSKKAQSGSQSAILIIIITVLLVLFILFLPPEDRDELLGNNQSSDNGGSGGSFSSILLRENPGSLKYVSRSDREFQLSGFRINTVTSGELVTSRNNIYVKNSAFEKDFQTVNFNVNNLLTNNLLLSFNVQKSVGKLIIKFNGDKIFDGYLGIGSAPPLSIDSQLVDRQNVLEFSVSSPGVAFWRYNEYDLRDVKLFADVTDVTSSVNQQSFSLTSDEVGIMRTASSSYIPVCETRDIKNFEIKVNNYKVFSGKPDCDVYNTVNIPLEYLFEGTNNMYYGLEEGSILMERPLIVIKMESHRPLTYYFEVEEKYFDGDDLKPNQEYNLELTFPDNEQKRFELLINGKVIGFNTARTKEQRLINHYLEPGTNSLQIRPLTDVTITQIRVARK